MSLFERYPVESPATETLVHPDYVVVIRKTKAGRDIMVCTAKVAPQAVVDEAKAMGIPLFVAREIERMRHCHPDQVEHIIATKITFPGCTVESILNQEIPA